jgi:signal transduction histidine kinase
MLARTLFRGLIPRRVRVRLTLLYGGLFAVSGAALLAITYLLVSRNTGHVFLLRRDGDQLTPALNATAQERRAQAIQQHQEELHHLLVQSGIALAIMLVISIALGWLVAGRVLRPLRTMTATVRHISARNVHERLAIDGPRDELKDLADTVDGLLGRLQAALEAHKRFVANAAHELRTPLTVEHALLEETLIDRDAGLQSFRTTFQRLLAISEQRARLLESLLTLATSERGLDRHEPMDLSVLAHQVVAGRHAEAGRRDVRIDTTLRPALVSGDPGLVESLMVNVFDNAIRYNVPGGIVEVTTGVQDGHAVFTVANSGPPVTAEQVHLLFEPFQRLERTRGHDDAHHGLGLSIVHAIAAAHNATSVARAHPDGGLTIEITFPAVEAWSSATQ